jgi:hypothetical protein
MDKPEFPKPTLIREDFLPEPMKNYRIKKVTQFDIEGTEWITYSPQVKVLWWWTKVFDDSTGYYGFSTLEDAQKYLCNYLKNDIVEFIDFDPSKDCK